MQRALSSETVASSQRSSAESVGILVARPKSLGEIQSVYAEIVAPMLPSAVTLVIGFAAAIVAIRNMRLQLRSQLKVKVYEEVSQLVYEAREQLSEAFSKLLMLSGQLSNADPGITSVRPTVTYYWSILKIATNGWAQIQSAKRRHRIVHCLVTENDDITGALPVNLLREFSALHTKLQPYLWVELADGRLVPGSETVPEQPPPPYLDDISKDIQAIATILAQEIDEANRLDTALQNELLGEVMGRRLKDEPVPTREATAN